MSHTEIPLDKIRMAEIAIKKEQGDTEKELQKIEEELHKLKIEQSKALTRSFSQFHELNILKIAGALAHIFPGPHPDLYQEVLELRKEVKRKDITVQESEDVIRELDTKTAMLQSHCPHHLVFGHHPRDLGKFVKSEPGHFICAFCGTEEEPEHGIFKILGPQDQRIIFDVGFRNILECIDLMRTGDLQSIFERHKDYEAVVKLMEDLKNSQ